MRQRHIDSQFAIRGIFLSTHIAFSARSMSGGTLVKRRRRRKRRHKSCFSKIWKALSARFWIASLRLLVVGLFGICNGFRDGSLTRTLASTSSRPSRTSLRFKAIGLLAISSLWVIYWDYGHAHDWRPYQYSGARPQVGGSCLLPGANFLEYLRSFEVNLCASVDCFGVFDCLIGPRGQQRRA